MLNKYCAEQDNNWVLRWVTYLSEEPVSFEWPEDWECVEHQRVWMWSVVTCEEAHFSTIVLKLLIIILKLQIKLKK